jgi:hypothetical protein
MVNEGLFSRPNERQRERMIGNFRRRGRREVKKGLGRWRKVRKKEELVEGGIEEKEKPKGRVKSRKVANWGADVQWAIQGESEGVNGINDGSGVQIPDKEEGSNVRGPTGPAPARMWPIGGRLQGSSGRGLQGWDAGSVFPIAPLRAPCPRRFTLVWRLPIGLDAVLWVPSLAHQGEGEKTRVSVFSSMHCISRSRSTASRRPCQRMIPSRIPFFTLPAYRHTAKP